MWPRAWGCFSAPHAPPRASFRQDLEEVVVASAREVGRAIENVAATIERGVLGNKGERQANRDAEGGSKTNASREESEIRKPKPPE